MFDCQHLRGDAAEHLTLQTPCASSVPAWGVGQGVSTPGSARGSCVLHAASLATVMQGSR